MQLKPPFLHFNPGRESPKVRNYGNSGNISVKNDLSERTKLDNLSLKEKEKKREETWSCKYASQKLEAA